MATLPSDHGCFAAHSTVSYASFSSLTNGVQTPSDSWRPLTSWKTYA